jgi:hypothetical protein
LISSTTTSGCSVEITVVGVVSVDGLGGLVTTSGADVTGADVITVPVTGANVVMMEVVVSGAMGGDAGTVVKLPISRTPALAVKSVVVRGLTLVMILIAKGVPPMLVIMFRLSVVCWRVPTVLPVVTVIVIPLWAILENSVKIICPSKPILMIPY